MEPRTANASASASGKRGRRKGRATGAEKPNLYDEVTARIITELEAGRAPWVQPWGAPGAKAGLPRLCRARRARRRLEGQDQ